MSSASRPFIDCAPTRRDTLNIIKHYLDNANSQKVVWRIRLFQHLLATRYIPTIACTAAAISLSAWFVVGSRQDTTMREPGADNAPERQSGVAQLPQLRGELTKGSGTPSSISGSWPAFRGPQLDGMSHESLRLARQWREEGPKALWEIPVGEGYAGAVVHKGRVYLIDYDHEQQTDAIRCLSLDDGKDIWRYDYSVQVKRNHGMSRTTPAVNDKYVVALGPKCHVTCLDAMTGKLKWGLDLVGQFGAEVPAWYAGQCPIINGGRVILAPGGKALIIAVDIESGKVLWESPNPKQWKMSHASITPMKLGGKLTYIYCASGGVAAVSAEDGDTLWETGEWKISIATVPSPVMVGNDKIFLSGGYNAGSMMARIVPVDDSWKVEEIFRLKPEVFGSAQYTPVYYKGNIYGVRPNGEMVCMNESGEVLWSSGAQYKFGYGPYIIADGLLYALNDSGMLTMMEASSRQFKPLAQAKVLPGPDAWGPIAVVNGRMIARDLRTMVCLDLR